VLEDVRFTPQELDAYMDAVGRDLLTQDVEDWLKQFEQATTFGSLIRPRVTDTAFIRERLDEVGAFHNLFLSHTQEKLEKVLAMTQALGQRYHVVVANPPYMGSRNMNRQLKTFLKDSYQDFKSDLFAAFTVRIMQMTLEGGFVGMMTPFTWMFLSSYEELRIKILDQSTLTTLVRPEYHAFFESAFVPVCAFSLFLQSLPDLKGAFIDLSDFYGADKQPIKTLEAINDPDCDWFHRASATDFKTIPGWPIAYWIPPKILSTFDEAILLGDILNAKTGITTGNNPKYIRLWSEVALRKIGFGVRDRGETLGSSNRWYPLNSGGQSRKWFGNFQDVILWEDDGKAIRARSNSNIRNQDYFFKEGLTWGKITSSNLSVRYSPTGSMFDAVGLMAFPSSNKLLHVLGLLNSKLVRVYTQALNPTLSTLIGDLNRIPFIEVSDSTEAELNNTIKHLVDQAERDWNAYETSWNFEFLPLLQSGHKKQVLASAYLAQRGHWQTTVDKVRDLEEKNNEFFIEVYDLKGELSLKVPLSEITFTCNPHYRYGSSRLKTRNWSNFCERFPEICDRLNTISAELAPEMPEEDRLGLEQRLLDDTMREFISYAVGCMFGRYSLDKPGLILANQGETLDDYLRQVPAPTFMPVADNVIPMLDGDWFPGDVTARFKQFLRVTFGDEHYEENLAFIELALNRDIRGYFLRNFYKDHLKRYSKRPIYWLFSSPKGRFNALIYLHRYRPDTVSVVLNDYLREFRTKLEARKRHLERIEASASASKHEKTRAVKEIAKIDKVLGELRDYEDDILYPLAMEQLEIDLDDGVAENYPKFGKALEYVKGVS
jgi:type II restriction/modification system DNA methylase subunit YeeA